jgi:hypothetical protein
MELLHAIQTSQPYQGIGWDVNKQTYVHYDPKEEAPEDVIPEFIFINQRLHVLLGVL